jgi:hypothetical protein
LDNVPLDNVPLDTILLDNVPFDTIPVGYYTVGYYTVGKAHNTHAHTRPHTRRRGGNDGASMMCSDAGTGYMARCLYLDMADMHTTEW